jgi:putative heme utilization carrier protein HutX
MTLSPTRAQALREHLTENPGAILEAVAADHDVTLLACIQHLPDALYKERAGAQFERVLTEVAGWGEVLTIVHTPDVIMEFAGPFPAGRASHGFYNLRAKAGLKGHLRQGRCERIVFLRRPFMGLATASIVFINEEGGSMFKIFVRRGEDRALDAEQLARFERLAEETS